MDERGAAKYRKKVWSTAFKVVEALKACSLPEITLWPSQAHIAEAKKAKKFDAATALQLDGKPKERIADALLKGMIGKSVLVVRYYAGQKEDDPSKMVLYKYERLFAVREGETLDEAKKRAADAVYFEYNGSDGRYPKGYMPDAFNEGQKRQKGAAPHGDAFPALGSGDGDSFDPEDDVPF